MKELQNLKLGVVGCGVHSTANILSTLHLLRQPIQAVAARHIEHAQDAAERFGIKHAYSSYREMLDKESLDAVFVITSADSQADIVKD